MRIAVEVKDIYFAVEVVDTGFVVETVAMYGFVLGVPVSGILLLKVLVSRVLVSAVLVSFVLSSAREYARNHLESRKWSHLARAGGYQ